MCQAVRPGRPQSLPSPSTVTLAQDGPMAPLSAAGLRWQGPSDCHSNLIWDKQRSKVMFTQQLLHFPHVMSQVRYMGGCVGEREAQLEASHPLPPFSIAVA